MLNQQNLIYRIPIRGRIWHEDSLTHRRCPRQKNLSVESLLVFLKQTPRHPWLKCSDDNSHKSPNSQSILPKQQQQQSHADQRRGQFGSFFFTSFDTKLFTTTRDLWNQNARLEIAKTQLQME
jgi:hypothetical protein